MKISIDIRMFFTLSKIMAYIMLFSSLSLSVYIKDASPFTFSLPFVSALILGKQAQRLLMTKYENEDSTIHSYYNPNGNIDATKDVRDRDDLS